MSIGSAVGTIPLVVANGGTGAATLTGAVVGNGSSAFTAGTLSVANGGTGATTLTGALVGNGTSAVTAGTLSVGNGGTGATTLTGLLVGNGTSAVTVDGYTAAASWTPAFSLATAGTSAWTYSSQFGRYCRLGPVIYFTAQLVWTSYSLGTGSGNWQVSLPAAAGAFTQPGVVVVSGTGIGANTADVEFFGTIASGASIALISYTRNTAGTVSSAVYAAAAVAYTGTMNIQGYYFAA
jgi:hypothetical protein